jgi:hypothetical protein
VSTHPLATVAFTTCQVAKKNKFHKVLAHEEGLLSPPWKLLTALKSGLQHNQGSKHERTLTRRDSFCTHHSSLTEDGKPGEPAALIRSGEEQRHHLSMSRENAKRKDD